MELYNRIIISRKNHSNFIVNIISIYYTVSLAVNKINRVRIKSIFYEGRKRAAEQTNVN